jgi:tRNA A-37 threonylcarbamoyl transferase component Bud32
MQTIELHPRFAAVFDHAGLRTFEDFFDYSRGQLINSNKKRDVLAFSLTKDDTTRHFYMKRFRRPHFKDMLFTLRNFSRLCSQAECEWKNANFLLANDIDTYKPACFGAETKLGIETRSFFITEKLSGTCLTDYVRNNWNRIDRSQKTRIVESVARFTKKIHDAGISMPDLYLWHFFVAVNDPQYDLAVIDLHRMRINTSSRTQQIRNLAALKFSMTDTYFDDDLWNTFIDAYTSSGFDGDKTRFDARISARARLLTSRRHPPAY